MVLWNKINYKKKNQCPSFDFPFLGMLYLKKKLKKEKY